MKNPAQQALLEYLFSDEYYALFGRAILARLWSGNNTEEHQRAIDLINAAQAERDASNGV